MEQILFIAMLWWIVATMKKHSKKKAAQQPPRAAQPNPLAQLLQQQDLMGERTHEGIHPCDEHVAPPAQQMSMPLPPTSGSLGEVTHEGIHPCDEHVAPPAQQMSMPLPPTSGSLGEVTHEGIHPCDLHNAAPLAAPNPPPEAVEEQPGLQLRWTGDSLVNAVIMQEVLTRPAQRRRA